MNKITKIERLLRWMAESDNGRSFIEINQYIVIVLFGINLLEYKQNKRRYSGYWNDVLYSSYNRNGIFERFCKKINGRWVVFREIKTPFTSVYREEEKLQKIKRLCIACHEYEHKIYSRKCLRCKKQKRIIYND